MKLTSITTSLKKAMERPDSYIVYFRDLRKVPRWLKKALQENNVDYRKSKLVPDGKMYILDRSKFYPDLAKNKIIKF